MSLREKRPLAPSSSAPACAGAGIGVGGGGGLAGALQSRARHFRNNPTEPEKRLWMALRGSRVAGFKFRRQDVIGSRIVDFFCPARGLIVEVDGDTHKAEIDSARDAQMLREFGYVTVRFTNEQVMRNLDGCLMHLQAELDRLPDRWAARARHHPPTPSSEEEGET